MTRVQEGTRGTVEIAMIEAQAQQTAWSSRHTAMKWNRERLWMKMDM